jgi:hypothetical protein
MHVVIRRWSNGASLADAMITRSQEVEDLLRAVPGFVAYYALRDGDTVSTVTVCNDQAGTHESTMRAAEWVRQNLTETSMAPPEVSEGETFIQFNA